MDRKSFFHKSYTSDDKNDNSTGFVINKNTRKNSYEIKTIYTEMIINLI